MNDEQLSRVAAQTNVTQFRPLLDPILIPRVVGTEGHEKVKQVGKSLVTPQSTSLMESLCHLFT